MSDEMIDEKPGQHLTVRVCSLVYKFYEPVF